MLHKAITIIIPLKNEERNLRECLENIRAFENVLLVDSGSTDASKDIFDGFREGRPGWEWVDFKWDGKFPKKRNWILRNHTFKTDWILFLDADERLTPAWCAEVDAALKDGSLASHDAYICFYDNWFMNRMLRHGDAMRKTALLRVGRGEYEKIEEDHWSSLDMEIHEHLVVKGSIGTLSARLEHHDKRPLESYRRKHEEYAKWEANRYLALARAGKLSDDSLTKRQKLKYNLLASPFFAAAYFLASYLLKRGFLDGRPGFVFARGKFRYFTRIRQLIRESGRAS